MFNFLLNFSEVTLVYLLSILIVALGVLLSLLYKSISNYSILIEKIEKLQELVDQLNLEHKK